MVSSSPTPLLGPRPPRAPLRRVAASAPMRVSLAGGGTDLPHIAAVIGGRVVGAAIDLRVRAVAAPFDRGWVRLALAPLAGAAGGGAGDAQARAFTRRRADPPREELEFRLLEAALASAGVTDGVALCVEAGMAPGAGLGGSAAATVAALLALRAASGERPLSDGDAGDLAREAVAVERDHLRIACGAQDQALAAFGGLLDLRFDGRGCSGVRALDGCSPDLVAALSAGLLLVDTQVRRVSGDVLAGVDALPRAGEVSELLASADDVAGGLADGSLERVLAGMRRSAAAKLRCSGAASAIAVELAAKLDGLGVEVLRMCGAGGGGHVLLWAPPACHARILEALGPCPVRRPTLGAPGARIEQNQGPRAPDAGADTPARG